VAAAQSAILTENAALDTPVAYLTLGAWVVAGMLGAWAVLRTRDA
jgi:ABC-2 type transport system permease protein